MRRAFIIIMGWKGKNVFYSKNNREGFLLFVYDFLMWLALMIQLIVIGHIITGLEILIKYHYK